MWSSWAAELCHRSWVRSGEAVGSPKVFFIPTELCPAHPSSGVYLHLAKVSLLGVEFYKNGRTMNDSLFLNGRLIHREQVVSKVLQAPTPSCSIVAQVICGNAGKSPFRGTSHGLGQPRGLAPALLCGCLQEILLGTVQKGMVLKAAVELHGMLQQNPDFHWVGLKTFPVCRREYLQRCSW